MGTVLDSVLYIYSQPWELFHSYSVYKAPYLMLVNGLRALWMLGMQFTQS